MDHQYIKLYNAGSSADAAYLLEEGTVYFYLSTVDKYSLTGKNIIIGSTELIMHRLLSSAAERIETAVTDDASKLKKISAERFLPGLETYSFAMNVSMVLARQVLLTNNIIQKNLAALAGDEKKVKELSMDFFKIVHRLREEYAKRKLPWLKTLIQQHADTLTYKKGEAYSKSSEPVRLRVESGSTDRDVEYPIGSVVFEEGTDGNEMFILKSGMLDVVIKGNKVASIDEPGTVIGEMALLLGERRTATLAARNRVIMTGVRKEDLKDLVSHQPDFLSCIAQTLAKRHFYNVQKIGHINESLAEQTIDHEMSGAKQVPHSQRAFKELSHLKEAVEESVREKKAEFLQDLVDTL